VVPETARAAAAPAPPVETSESARVLPFVDRSRGVQVEDDQGLLVVEGEADGPPPRVLIDGRSFGGAPISVALAGGRHEIRLRQGDRSSVRYVVMRPGETRILELGP
jgi:hypothetical protein